MKIYHLTPNLGDEVKKIRKSYHLSLRDLASICDTNHGVLNTLEKNNDTKVSLLEKLADGIRKHHDPAFDILDLVLGRKESIDLKDKINSYEMAMALGAKAEYLNPDLKARIKHLEELLEIKSSEIEALRKESSRLHKINHILKTSQGNS